MYLWAFYFLSLSLPLRFQSNVLTSTIDRLQIIECAFIVRSTESLCFNDDAGYLDFSHFNLFETRARIDARARGLRVPMNIHIGLVFCWLLLDWKDEALARAWANRFHFSSEMRWFKFVFRAESLASAVISSFFTWCSCAWFEVKLIYIRLVWSRSHFIFGSEVKLQSL